MRIPFPVKLSLQAVAAFAAVVCVVQQFLGTSGYFSLCCFLFIFLSAVAFNIAGGFSSASGGYIFFFSMLTGTVGWVVKDFVGEAGDSNLAVPNVTVSVYLGIMVSISVAAFLSKKIASRKPLLGNFLADDKAPITVIGCTVVGSAILLAEYILPHSEGGFLAFVMQANQWIPLAIVIGVTYEVKRSGGRRSLSPIIILAAGMTFVLSGLLNFSKLGIFTPIACYLLACAAAGFRFSIKQILFGSAGMFLILHFLIPYAQYGRVYRMEETNTANFVATVEHSYTLMTTLGDVRNEYITTIQEAEAEDEGGNYFNHTQGIFDRLTMFRPDDGLIAATLDGHNLYGLYPLWYEVYNAVPRFLWPDKPVFMFGNLYAHEMGGLGDEDFSTGISFSAAGQSYHMAGWVGVLVIAPLVFTVFFTFFDSLCGDVRQSPWGLLTLAFFANAAPEAMLDGCIYMIWHFGLPLIGVAAVCAYIMPIIGSFITAPAKREIRLSVPAFQPRPGLVTPVSSPRAGS